jgi:hypothetical protein
MSVTESVVKFNSFCNLFQKLGVFLLLAFFLLGCEDKSYFKQVYNKKLFSKKISCLRLELSPYNQELYEYSQTLFFFIKECPTTLQIRYKTDIGCNSPYKTANFSSFVELNLVQNNKTYFTIYKDLQDEDIKNEIKKAFVYLQKHIVIK